MSGQDYYKRLSAHYLFERALYKVNKKHSPNLTAPTVSLLLIIRRMPGLSTSKLRQVMNRNKRGAWLEVVASRLTILLDAGYIEARGEEGRPLYFATPLGIQYLNTLEIQLRKERIDR